MSELPGGWDLDDVAAIAVHIARTQQILILDREEAADIAAVAIIARLYAEPAPERIDLYRAARAALSSANSAEYSYAGLDANASRAHHGDYTRTPPGYARYWHGTRGRTSPFEDDLLDRIALGQVWAALPANHRLALRTLAEHETYPAAAAALGVTGKAWERRIDKARTEARRLWNWPEPPGRYWGHTWHGHVSTDRRARTGISVRIGKMRANRRKAA